MSTSDLCKTLIQPATVPRGWVCEPECILHDDAANDFSANGWYKHCYVKASTGARKPNWPPIGTMSTCQRLAADPATAGFIGTPTLFFSHAWLQKFLNNVDALRAFVAARPLGSPEAFFWYDCFAIDQYECQYPDPAKPKKSSEWWSSTFLQAIGSIGSTVMMMSPWDAPTPLRRSWYLWELYRTAASGSELSICLGPAEEVALEAALLADPGSLLDSFASIDVASAEAGGREDQERILAAVRALPGGSSGLNGLAMERMREFVRQKVRAMESARGRLVRRREAGAGGGLAAGGDGAGAVAEFDG